MQDASFGNNEKYKIVFCGDMKANQDMISVKARLAAFLGVTGALVEKLFRGKPVLVNSDLPLDEAQLFKLEFEKTGAICQMLEVSAVPQPSLKPKELAGIIKPRPMVSAQPSQGADPPYPQETAPIGSQPVTFEGDRQFSYRRQPGKKNPLPIILSVVAILAVLGIIANLSSSKKKTDTYTPSIPTTSPSSRIKSSGRSGVLPEQTKPFDDPKGYYSISLPGGYRTANKSSGTRSKISFTYSRYTNITILASPMKRMWNPQEEMTKKISEIQSGKAGVFSRYQVDRYNLIDFNRMHGYEIILSTGNDIAHAYAVVSESNIAFSIAIVCMGKNSRENHDILVSAVRDNLEAY